MGSSEWTTSFKASTTLREGFRKELADELQRLKDSNAAQLKQLEDELVSRIALLEKDTYIRSDFRFQFNQALAADADERYGDARYSYRLALSVYKSGQARDLFKKTAAERTLANLFYSFEEEDGVSYVANAKEELAREVYNGLEDELARTALQHTWLAPLSETEKRARPPHCRRHQPPSHQRHRNRPSLRPTRLNPRSRSRARTNDRADSAPPPPGKSLASESCNAVREAAGGRSTLNLTTEGAAPFAFSKGADFAGCHCLLKPVASDERERRAGLKPGLYKIMEEDYRFAPKASRRPSQSFTTNSRQCHAMLPSPRANATPWAAYSA